MKVRRPPNQALQTDGGACAVSACCNVNLAPLAAECRIR